MKYKTEVNNVQHLCENILKKFEQESKNLCTIIVHSIVKLIVADPKQRQLDKKTITEIVRQRMQNRITEYMNTMGKEEMNILSPLAKQILTWRTNKEDNIQFCELSNEDI